MLEIFKQQKSFLTKAKEQKQDMTDMVISGDEGGLKQLTSTDLDYILG